MPRMKKFILKACLAITSGLSTQTLAEDGVPFETAKAIGQRVAWTVPLPGGEVRHAEQLGNQLYVLDEQNFLSSLNLQSGRIMWSVQVTGAESTPDFIHTFEMRRGQGLAAKVTPMVLVGLGSELLKFDGTNGAMTKRVSMDRLPDTNPIEVGKYMVFGTNRGVVQWYNPDLEVPWRAFDCGDAMACDVSAGGDLLVAAARDGGVLCLQSGNGALIWRKKLLGPATGPAAISGNKVYVASADGYIRCYNHFDSPVAWERLLEGAPAGGPIVAEEDCYVAVPGKGLHAFVAAPRDEPGGVLSWISEKADGQIIAHDDRTLLLHDAEDAVLRVVRRKDGRVTAEVPAGADRFLQTTGPLVAFVGKSGVVGLTKRN